MSKNRELAIASSLLLALWLLPQSLIGSAHMVILPDPLDWNDEWKKICSNRGTLPISPIIGNTGDNTLYFKKEEVLVSGSSFILASCPDDISISAGRSAKPFKIELKANRSPGTHTGYLKIGSNADNSPVQCELVAEVVACGEVEVDPSPLFFNDTEVGDSSDNTFDIENVGDADLTVKEIYVFVCESDFKIVDPSLPRTISPGDDIEVTVWFIPTVPGTRSGAVCIESDGVKEKVNSPALLGNGVGIEEAGNALLSHSLGESHPNPFLQATIIKYLIACPSRLSLKIYNLAGEMVRTLVNEQQKAGYYTIHWDGTDNSGKRVIPGIYFYRMEAGKFEATKKLTILR